MNLSSKTGCKNYRVILSKSIMDIGADETIVVFMVPFAVIINIFLDVLQLIL